MKTIDIKNVKAKFNTYSDSSRITFETTDHTPVVWIQTEDFESGFVSADDTADIDNLRNCWDCVDDVYGESEEEWEANANVKLEHCDVELGDYHDEDEYYDLRHI